MQIFIIYKTTLSILLICIGLSTFNCGSDTVIDAVKQEINTRKIDFSSIEEADRRLNYEGLDYFRRKNYPLALDKFKAAWSLDKQNPEYSNNAGICYLRMGNHAQAETQFQQALKLRKLGLYYSNLGLALVHQTKNKSAADAFEKAVKLDNKDFSSWTQLGRLYAEKKDFSKARNAWKQAALLNNNAELQNNLGITYLQQGKYQLARIRFQKAVELGPAYALAHFNLGVALQNESKLEQATESYEKSIQLQPKAFQPHLNLGILYQKLAKKDAAIRSLENFIKLCPSGLKTQIGHARRRLADLNKS